MARKTLLVVLALIKTNMKKLILIFVLLIPFYTKAEYDKWNFKIAIKTFEGKELVGYGVTVIELNTDSLGNSNYLIKTLTEGQDSLLIYRNRIAYNNTSDKAPMHTTEYVLLNRIAISSKSIKSMKISDWDRGSTLCGIDNEITLSDRSWMNKKPIEIVHVFAHSCEYDIFIHEKNSKLDALVQEFKKVAKKYEKSEDPINVDEIRAHQKLIKKMKGLKVVVISFCTC